MWPRVCVASPHTDAIQFSRSVPEALHPLQSSTSRASGGGGGARWRTRIIAGNFSTFECSIELFNLISPFFGCSIAAAPTLRGEEGSRNCRAQQPGMKGEDGEASPELKSGGTRAHLFIRDRIYIHLRMGLLSPFDLDFLAPARFLLRFGSRAAIWLACRLTDWLAC